jgi:hypothetical protein
MALRRNTGFLKKRVEFKKKNLREGCKESSQEQENTERFFKKYFQGWTWQYSSPCGLKYREQKG